MSRARYELEGETIEVSAHRDGNNGIELIIGDRRRTALVKQQQLVMDGHAHALRVARVAGGSEIFIEMNGEVWVVRAQPAFDTASNDLCSPDVITAIMPGTVISVSVAMGDAIAAGDELLVLESMKLHSSILAPHTARVAEVLTSAGANVDRGDVLVRFEREEPANKKESA